MAPPLKASPIGRSANCTFPQDCSSLQEYCAYFTTEDWKSLTVANSLFKYKIWGRYIHGCYYVVIEVRQQDCGRYIQIGRQTQCIL